MRITAKKVMVNDQSRLFIRRDSCACYEYQNCYAIGDLSQSRGEPTKIECSDGKGGFQEIGVIKGELSRVTTEIRSYDYLHYEQALDTIFKSDCKIDIQVHFGECANPSSFNDYDRIIVLNDVYSTSYGKSTLSALTSGDREPIITSLGLSAKEFYTIERMSYAASIVSDTGPFTSVAAQCQENCPDCPCECTTNAVLALQIQNDPDNVNESSLFLHYSFDGGVNFTEIELPCFNIAHAIDPLTCDGIVFFESPNIRLENGQIIITVSPGQSIVYDLETLCTEGRLEQISYTGRVGDFDYAVYDSAVCGNYTYFVGQNGNAHRVNNVTGQATAISLLTSQGVQTTSDLYSVKCSGNEFIVGGEDGVWTGSGVIGTFSNSAPTNVLNVDIDESRYLAATATSVYFSCDCGSTWDFKWQIQLTNYCIKDINFYNKDVGFMILNNTTVQANTIDGPLVYRTIDGGCTWQRIDKISLPTNYVLMEVVACSVNKFYAVGYTGTPQFSCNPDEVWDPQLSYEAIVVTGDTIV